MKKGIIFLAMVLAVIMMAGCGARYNFAKLEKDKAGWSGKMNVEKYKKYLAVQKLENSTSDADATKGYAGILKNYRKKGVIFKVSGTENTSWRLDPNQLLEDQFLLPGHYGVQLFEGGKLIGTGSFMVGPEKKSFNGTECHWFLTAE